MEKQKKKMSALEQSRFFKLVSVLWLIGLGIPLLSLTGMFFAEEYYIANNFDITARIQEANLRHHLNALLSVVFQKPIDLLDVEPIMPHIIIVLWGTYFIGAGMFYAMYRKCKRGDFVDGTDVSIHT